MEKEIKFSIRELEIIHLIAQAKCRKSIADELKISIHTVDTHLRNIRLKSNTHTLLELAIWMLNNQS
jgi:two-component system secretion response regulator SsrB